MGLCPNPLNDSILTIISLLGTDSLLCGTKPRLRKDGGSVYKYHCIGTSIAVLAVDLHEGCICSEIRTNVLLATFSALKLQAQTNRQLLGPASPVAAPSKSSK
jgi:hypothetical protein